MTDNTGWNYDMGQAPKDGKIIAAGRDEWFATVTYWMPEENRWHRFGVDETPSAWIALPGDNQ